jgi:ABC-type dipeptide/oligopeptide/nickel transport system permease component
MTHATSVWLVLLALLLAANLPFVNDRWLAVVPRRAPKTLWIRVGEMLVFYALAIALGLALEQSAGQIAPQGWAFYAVTGALFLTLAFPGFVYRYLYKRKH